MQRKKEGEKEGLTDAQREKEGEKEGLTDAQREKEGEKEGLTDAQTQRERERERERDRAVEPTITSIRSPSSYPPRDGKCSIHPSTTKIAHQHPSTSEIDPHPRTSIPPPWASIHIHELRSLLHELRSTSISFDPSSMSSDPSSVGFDPHDPPMPDLSLSRSTSPFPSLVDHSLFLLLSVWPSFWC